MGVEIKGGILGSHGVGESNEDFGRECGIQVETEHEEVSSGVVQRDYEYKEKVLSTTALTRNKAQLFPTTRRPQGRELVKADEGGKRKIQEWFGKSQIKVGTQLTVGESWRAKTLLYTWRDIFETDLLKIKQTDLIEHAIVLLPGAKPTRARIPLYTKEKSLSARNCYPG